MASSAAIISTGRLRRFESLIDMRILHVHINHGESDKQSMASNNAKAYDRVFVAGEAAVHRHRAGLLEFDLTRLVRVGRPPLELHLAPLISPSPRPTFVYAPTWEGDADYNDYSSVDLYGPDIVRSIVVLPDVRLVYKPHPKVTSSTNAAIRDGHHAFLTRLAHANNREPDAGHRAIRCGTPIAVTQTKLRSPVAVPPADVGLPCSVRHIGCRRPRATHEPCR